MIIWELIVWIWVTHNIIMIIIDTLKLIIHTKVRYSYMWPIYSFLTNVYKDVEMDKWALRRIRQRLINGDELTATNS